MGWGDDGNPKLNGKFDEFVVFSRTLTDPEMKCLANVCNIENCAECTDHTDCLTCE